MKVTPPHPTASPVFIGCTGECVHTPAKFFETSAIRSYRAFKLDRRDFVKTFINLSVIAFAGGKQLTDFLVAEVSAQIVNQVGIFRVNTDTAGFTVLKNDFGSVRVRVPGMPTSFREIIITRVPEDVFHSVTSNCTHQGTTVNPYNASVGALRCPNHGSLFAPDGTVIGGPAFLPLTNYNTSFDGDKTIAIEIPGLGYSATLAGVSKPATGGTQIRLEFPTISTLRYGVRFRASVPDSQWVQVPFATTADATPTLTVLSGNNSKATVFVQSSAEFGFYAIVRGVSLP